MFNSDGNLVAVVGIFLVILLGSVLAGELPPIVFALYFVASGVTFFAYALDKSAAQKNQWRTKESTLHLCGLAGGWPGALIAQKVLRHKSKKQPFQTIFRATAVLNCSVLFVCVFPTIELPLKFPFFPGLRLFAIFFNNF